MTENTGKMRDWILSLYTPNTGELKVQGLDILDEIEREIAERFVELPTDADGVPIHVGDAVEYPNGRRDVVRFITVNDNQPTFNECGWVASKCRHVKPRTVEDVLTDLAEDVERGCPPLNAVAKYIGQLRELMGVDE